LLGLGANINAARGLKSSAALPKGIDPLKGFASFEDFKDAFGAAGPGQAWHHAVEQTINSGMFPSEILHNPANLFKLSHGLRCGVAWRSNRRSVATRLAG
jgi:hypothetical protein